MPTTFDKQAKATTALLIINGNISANVGGSEYTYTISSLIESVKDRYLILKARVVLYEGKKWNSGNSLRYLIYDTNKMRLVSIFVPNFDEEIEPPFFPPPSPEKIYRDIQAYEESIDELSRSNQPIISRF